MASRSSAAAVLAAMVFAGCIPRLSPPEAPAVLTNPSARTRDELARDVSRALNGAPVTIAESALTATDVLIVGRTERRDARGRDLNGRELGRPDHFRLVKSGARCVLVHEETGRRWTLRSATCRVMESSPSPDSQGDRPSRGAADEYRAAATGRHSQCRRTMSTVAFACERPGGSPLIATPADGGEVERLRLLIDRQPGCLLRLGVDSVVLAANDAALGQLAARDLGEIWGTALLARFPLEQQGRWDEFVEHVRENGAASAEFSLQDLDGNAHAVLLQGVSQPRHPDGVESMIVAVRDTSGVKRLEQTLQDLSGVQNALADARTKLEETMADQQRLLGTLAERDAELWRLAAEHASDEARIRTLTEEHRLALESKEREWQQQVEALRREAEEATAARGRLEEQMAEQEEGRRALEARKAVEASQLAAVLANAVKATVMAHRLVQATARGGGVVPADEAPETRSATPSLARVL